MTLKSLKVLLATLLLLAMTPSTASTQSDKQITGLPLQSPSAICGPIEHLSVEQFASLMESLRKAWLDGNAERIVTCFSPTAILSIPPSPGVVGRDNIAKTFASGLRSELPKRVDWHHIIFDPAQQTGALEFTIERRILSHGVIVIKLSNGLISNWREYAIASDLNWEKFRGMNNF